MSLPVIAIAVAAASALFTACNMLVTLATYRRGGPRLKVRVTRRPYKLYDAYLAGNETKWRMSYHVHVVNRSSASIEVEKVQVIPHLTRLTIIPYNPILRSLINRELLNYPELDSWTGIEFLEGGDRKKIEPFGGARWILQDKLSAMATTWIEKGLPDFLFSVATSLQLRVTLTNGREIYSHPISLRKLAKENDRVSQDVAEFANKQATIPGQLSFDDLAQAED
ncbi:hypothetical protein QQY66_37525 [Streptomyces sp. DG2A-72]|uniref:hypothetical protein n=1 Tax=Streptomyces sp. DG2A-72 TaxID=3051386 RepID=UPI00265BB135|nr:hypothetical protein [Streptomyces sp. DG2A-72]MDO0937142.1 hypothetical protein [Streptomyces sp. DG2A-72]